MHISVIIPSYNRWPLLRRAVESVLAQSRPADQIIVVDDGSTDASLDQLSRHYPTQLTILTQSNAGVSAARNAGIRNATGDWIALLDSDDEWLPGKLEAQEKTIAAHPTSVLCHTEEIWIRNGVRVNAMKKHTKQGGDIFLNCLPLCVISPSSVLLRRSIFDSIGDFDESLPACEDYDLWLRICSVYPVLFLPQAMLIKYGGHDDQLSRKYWGMDRFRLQSLTNLLRDGQLNDHQRSETINTLMQKTRILRKGAIKHHNHELIDICNTIQAEYGSISANHESC